MGKLMGTLQNRAVVCKVSSQILEEHVANAFEPAVFFQLPKKTTFLPSLTPSRYRSAIHPAA